VRDGVGKNQIAPCVVNQSVEREEMEATSRYGDETLLLRNLRNVLQESCVEFLRLCFRGTLSLQCLEVGEDRPLYAVSVCERHDAGGIMRDDQAVGMRFSHDIFHNNFTCGEILSNALQSDGLPRLRFQSSRYRSQPP